MEVRECLEGGWRRGREGKGKGEERDGYVPGEIETFGSEDQGGGFGAGVLREKDGAQPVLEIGVGVEGVG